MHDQNCGVSGFTDIKAVTGYVYPNIRYMIYKYMRYIPARKYILSIYISDIYLIYKLYNIFPGGARAVRDILLVTVFT